MALKTFTKEVNLGTTSGTYGSSAKLKLTVVENSINSTNNTSNVTATLEFIIAQYSWRASTASWSLSGYKSASGSLVSMQYYSGTTTLWSQTFDVAHDSSTGDATISFNFSFTSTNVYGGSGSLSCALTNIPRKAKITSFSVNKRDETSVTFAYTTDSTLDYAWYSKDDGNTWYDLPNTKIVSGLSAGTTYNFKLRVRRQDSQLTTVSDRKQQSTYPYPSINSAPNFIIGNSLTIGLTNPLNRSCTLYMIGDDDTVATSTVTITGTSTTNGFNSSAWKDFFYNSIPDKPSGTYKIRLVCSAVSRDTTTTGGTYSIRGDELPIITTTAIDTNKTLPNSNTPTNTIQSLTNDTTNKTIIKYISDAQVNVSGEGQYGTTINGNTYATQYGTQPSNAGDEYTYQNVEDIIFKGYGTDRRGLTNNSQATGLTLINYIKLTLDNIELYRDEQTSNTLKCRGDGDYYSGQFGTNGVNNSIVFKLRYKEHSASTWSSWSTKTMTIGTNEYTFNFQVGTNFDYTKTYDFEFDIRDKCMGFVATQTSKPGIPIQGLFENFHEAFGVKTFEKDSNDNVSLNPDMIPFDVQNSYNTSTTDTYSCNYINGIIESGSNTNGKWAKFADGTLICYEHKKFTFSINGSWGAVYSSGDNTIKFNDFPQTFLDIPAVTVTFHPKSGSYNGWLATGGDGISATNAGGYQLVRPTSVSSNNDYWASYIAIGKWK